MSSQLQSDSDESLDDLEKSNEGKADYIIVIPSDMTKTYATDPMFTAAKPSKDNQKEKAAKPKPKAQQAGEEDDELQRMMRRELKVVFARLPALSLTRDLGIGTVALSNMLTAHCLGPLPEARWLRFAK